jgi:hypothetical protein
LRATDAPTSQQLVDLARHLLDARVLRADGVGDLDPVLVEAIHATDLALLRKVVALPAPPPSPSPSPRDCDPSSPLARILTMLEPFLERTEMLLTLGGDDRLTVDFHGPTQANKYHCSPLPSPPAIPRGSCTCSKATYATYLAADAMRHRMLGRILAVASKRSFLHAITDNSVVAVESAAANAMFEMNTEIRTRLQAVCGLGAEAEVVLFPSGSDAELLPLTLALARAGPSGKVYNFVTAAGEVGSGTPNAAGGRHFSPLSPRGSYPYPHLAATQDANGYLAGWDGGRVEVVQYKPRRADGEVDLQEERLVADVRARLGGCDGGSVGSDVDDGGPASAAAAAAGTSVAVLHVVLGSKTGLVCPSAATVALLSREYGARLVVAVDACQLRNTLDAVGRHVQQGHVVLVTGSKVRPRRAVLSIPIVPIDSYHPVVRDIHSSTPGRLFPARWYCRRRPPPRSTRRPPRAWPRLVCGTI